MSPRALVFYPYFPIYRRRILTELRQLTEARIQIAAGTTGRASITPLTPNELPELSALREVRIGPLSFHPEILRQPTLKQFDAVVVAPATLSLSVWAILIARRISRRSTLLWGQCGRPGERGIKRIAQEAMNRLASRLLVYGDMEKRSACELGTLPEKVDVVRNAADHNPRIHDLSSEQFVQLANARGLGQIRSKNDPINLLYIGRVTPGKKLERLIECIEMLRRRGYLATATIVGDGTALDQLKSIAEPKRLPIDFPGGLHTDDELQPFLDKATVIVAPNSIGLLAIDALNNGIPVIYPNSSGKNGPEQEALSPGINSVEFYDLSGTGLANAVEHWLNIAPTIDTATFEAEARSSASKWSPQAVALKIGNAVLASLNKA